MTKAIGFKQGQIGDLVIQTAVAAAFKEQYHDTHLTFGIGSKYKDMLPLFFNHPFIDDYHIWDGYDNWPSNLDVEYIKFKNFDFVFDAMGGHTQANWYNFNHYATEDCLIHGIKPLPKPVYYLNKWFPLHSDCNKIVTLSLFPSKSTQMDKTLRIQEAEKFCKDLRTLGFTPLQLGGRFDYKLDNAICPDFSIFEATKYMLSSKVHVTADTSFASIAAGYNHPTIGFYGLNYPDMTDCFSHLPPNRNAYYFRNINPQEVTADMLLGALKMF